MSMSNSIDRPIVWCAAVDCRQDGWAPIGIASVEGHEGVVMQLLACGATVSERDGKSAIVRGHTAVANALRARVC